MECTQSNIFFGIMLILTLYFIVKAHTALSVREKDTKELIEIGKGILKKRRNKKMDISKLISIRGNHD